MDPEDAPSRHKGLSVGRILQIRAGLAPPIGPTTGVVAACRIVSLGHERKDWCIGRSGSGTGDSAQVDGVIAQHGANITSVDLLEERQTYFEIDVTDEAASVIKDLSKLPIVRSVTQVKTFQTVFGKRIIIMGGGAQVGQVAIGAISEADRHNIRGEHIS